MIDSVKKIKSLFNLQGKVIVITGGAGFLGVQHAEAIAEFGANPVLLDINLETAKQKAEEISKNFGVETLGLSVDITNEEAVEQALSAVLEKFGRVDGLINNAANDPKIKDEPGQKSWTKFENFPIEVWQNDLTVSLTGSFLCSQIFGRQMAKQGGGVILNIASDLGVIAPDQRIYRQDGLNEEFQPAKPVTYSVVKHGIIGLTKYLASYWGQTGIRVNAISPGGVYNNQPQDFVDKLTRLIPLGRMANVDEYKGAIVLLMSDASNYVTGINLIVDGGRTCV